jgi:hypothetical protein
VGSGTGATQITSLPRAAELVDVCIIEERIHRAAITACSAGRAGASVEVALTQRVRFGSVG